MKEHSNLMTERADADEYDPGPDQDLRYEVEPVEALRVCQGRFVKNDKEYREWLYEMIGTVYAVSRRMVGDDDRQQEFFAEPYWEWQSARTIKTNRDLFRAVFSYLLNAKSQGERQQASKYAKVAWHLDNENADPEHAASWIATSGGIDKVARQGSGSRSPSIGRTWATG